MVTEEETSPSMPNAGYVQEGKYQKRHCLTFGFLICVTLTLLLLVAVGASLLGWWLITNRDREFFVSSVVVDSKSGAEHDGTYLTDPVHYGKENDDQQNHENNEVVSITTTTSTEPTQPKTTTTLKETTVPTSRMTTPPVVTDTELSDLINSLWSATAGSQLIINRDYMLSFQGQTNATDTEDRASNRLFSRMMVDIRSHSPLYRKFTRLLRAYTALWEENSAVDHVALRNLANNFLERISTTDAMHILETFLVEKGLLDTNDGIMSLLDSIWFDWYPSNHDNQGRQTNGFQRVFVGEPTEGAVVGLHNWLQFYLEEKHKTLDYEGYVSKHEVGIVKIKFSWNAHPSQITTFFVGTSPDFEMSVYTLCLLTRANDSCGFTFLGKSLSVTAHDVENVPELQMKMAHPVL